MDDQPSLRIAISGSSGLMGTCLREFWTARGHAIVRIVRSAADAGPDDVVWQPRGDSIDAARLEGVDAVVHLAGENLASGRWTAARKARILESRRQGTRLLARTLAGLDAPPRAFISASAVGYYGDTGDAPVDERAAAGDGFLAEVCQYWEAATQQAADAGIRTVRARFGVVISPDGGPLEKMLTPFKLGMGGRIGSGEQWMSWIDLDDLARAIDRILTDDALSGPVNVATPHPVKNRRFTEALGEALGRPALLPVPRTVIKLAFGQMGDEALLKGQRVVPRKLQEAGFSWEYPTIEASFAHQLRG